MIPPFIYGGFLHIIAPGGKHVELTASRGAPSPCHGGASRRGAEGTPKPLARGHPDRPADVGARCHRREYSAPSDAGSAPLLPEQPLVGAQRLSAHLLRPAAARRAHGRSFRPEASLHRRRCRPFPLPPHPSPFDILLASPTRAV